MRKHLVKELEFCLKLWEEQGHCSFGGHTNCEECAAPYLIYKLITGEALHGDMERLKLDDWSEILDKLIQKN